MTILNTRDAAVAHASRHLVSADDQNALSARLDRQLKVLFAKDPDAAEARVWAAGAKLGMDACQVHAVIAGYRID